MWHIQWLYCLEEAVNPLRNSSLRTDSYVDDYLMTSVSGRPIHPLNPFNQSRFQNIICKDMSDPVTVEIIPIQNLFQVNGDGHTHRFSFWSSFHAIVSFKTCLSLLHFMGWCLAVVLLGLLRMRAVHWWVAPLHLTSLPPSLCDDGILPESDIK